MIKAIGLFMAALSVNVFHFYAWHKFLNKKIKFKDYRLYIILIVTTILIMINYFWVNNLVKVTTATCLLILANKILFKEEINRSIITVLLSQFIIMIAETMWAIVFLQISKINNAEYITQKYFGKILINIIIVIIAFIILHIKPVKKLSKILIKATDKIKNYELAILIMLIVVIINLVFGFTYYSANVMEILVLNAFLVLIYIFVILKLTKVKNEYVKVEEKYNTTLESLKEYEDILDKYRVSNHENKNQLLTIRRMIKKQEKGVNEYLDSLISNTLKDNQRLAIQTNIIPSGGLRAVVYTKMSYMKDLGIKTKLIVDKKVKTVDLLKLGDNIMLDICKVIGVYLDNAIDAVKELEKKEVLIEMYVEKKKLNIAITNNYKGVLNLEKIEEMGYSTKGKNRGYGLYMVKEVIERNRRLSNKKSVNNDTFTQKLIIKM